jgi:hypothetical protein
VVNVYNIIYGMEGDKVNDPGSVTHEKRMKNGWQNSGSPWTYNFNPELIGYPSVKRWFCSLTMSCTSASAQH